MRIAVVSDIHGNLDALEAVVQDIRRRGADMTVNLGDSLSGPLLPLETAQYLMAQSWVHLAGNHERQILTLHANSSPADLYAHSTLGNAQMQWIASLPSVKPLFDDVLLCHGTPKSDYTALLQTAEHDATKAEIDARLDGINVPLILCGHTHIARIFYVTTDRLIVNPGSVGHPAYADDYPYPHVVESGSPDARYTMLEKREGRWQASLLAVPYDNSRMVALAKMRNRPDWECALRTGRMS